MFYYLEGNITVIESNLVVVDVGGAGYLCYTTINTMSHLEKGKKARLYTYCNVKEDAFDIYGFYDISEKRCFELLLSVSGVGPKAALSILSASTPEGLTTAIITENDKLLTSAPGIGKRIAQRIILELKDKISKESAGITPAVLPGAPAAASGSAVAEATAALTVLGYSTQEINAAMRGVDTAGLSTEDIIRQVLRNSVK